jgi:hypothetical protein
MTRRPPYSTSILCVGRIPSHLGDPHAQRRTTKRLHVTPRVGGASQKRARSASTFWQYDRPLHKQNIRAMLTENEKPPQSVSSSSCLSDFEIKYTEDRYAIEKLHERDDHELLPKWKRLFARLVPITTILSVGSYYLYFPYRIYCTRESMVKYEKNYVMAWFFIVAEALVARKDPHLQPPDTLFADHMGSTRSFPPSLVDLGCKRAESTQATPCKPACTDRRCPNYLLQGRCGCHP